MKFNLFFVFLTRLGLLMAKRGQAMVVGLAIGMLISACGPPNHPPSSMDNTGTNPAQFATEVEPAEAITELVPTDTPQAQVDLSAWGASYLVKYSPDGSLLAVANAWDIHVYDPATLEEIIFIPGEVEGGRGLEIVDFSFSPDNKVLSVAYYDNSANAFGVRQLDISTGAEISKSVVFEMHDDYSQKPNLLSVSPDGTTFALVDRSTSLVRMWDVASGQESPSFGEGYPGCLVFSPDSTMLVVCDSGVKNRRSAVALWDVSSGSKIRSFDVLNSHNSIYTLRIAFSTDASILAIAATYDYVLDDSFTVMLLDFESGEELLSFDVPVAPSMAGVPVFAMAFSNDGAMLATGSAMGLKIWDTASGNELQSINMPVENNAFTRWMLTFSPDDLALLSASDDLYQVIMWDVATGEQLAP